MLNHKHSYSKEKKNNKCVFSSKMYINSCLSTTYIYSFRLPLFSLMSFRCCYINVYFTTAASQNGYTVVAKTFPFIRKPILFRKWQGAVVKNHYMTHFWVMKTSFSDVAVCKIHRFVAAPFFSLLYWWSLLASSQCQSSQNESWKWEETKH